MYGRVRLLSRSDTDKPVIFVGDPGSLAGEVWLENAAAEALELRRASVVSPGVRAADLTSAGRVAQISIPKYIRAHERQLLSVSFDLDRSTPPGTYDASIVLEDAEGTATFPAQIVVTQNYALSIEPDQLVVTAPPAGTFNGEVMVVNEGNVPIDVVPLGEFPLEDPWREPRCCYGHDVGHEREAESERERKADDDFGTVTIDNSRATVEPGTSALVRFVARLSAGLPPNTHLRAKPRIGIERFNLDVITSPGDGDIASRSESGRRRSLQKKKRS